MKGEDRVRSIEIFRTERLGEPTELYQEVLNRCQAHFEDLLELTVDLTQFPTGAIPELLKPNMFRALRYVAGPPVSSDDLRVLAQVRSIAPQELLRDDIALEKVLEVVLQAFDRERFPWLSHRPMREASAVERDKAVFASAALLASAQMGTARRHQEGAKSDTISAELVKLGLREAPRRTIRGWADIPEVGTFFRKARSDVVINGREVKNASDFVIRTDLYSVDVLMCRVSNSALNSRKRLLKEAVPIARDWRQILGLERTRTAVVLGGVFDEETLVQAESNDLQVLWLHNISNLIERLEGTAT